MSRPDKSLLLMALRSRIEQELATLREAQSAAQEGAIHEETRQEDPKDTRAIEAQYIARGLTERVESLQGTIVELYRVRLGSFDGDTPVGLSALVALQDRGEERTYFIVPVAGGETLVVDGTTVLTLTPTSPLGQALIGKCVDDEIDLELPGRRLEAIVEWIA